MRAACLAFIVKPPPFRSNDQRELILLPLQKTSSVLLKGFFICPKRGCSHQRILDQIKKHQDAKRIVRFVGLSPNLRINEINPAPATKESKPSERRLFLCLLNHSSFVLSILPNSCLGDRSS